MRWLVTGAGGMLATDVVPLLRDRGHQVTALTRADLDITAAQATRAAVADHDVVLNCAAWTAVDDAENREAEAFAVNAVGAANLARAAHGAGARMVQISTDYVFDGNATTGYAADHPLAPRSAYGRTKAAGEWAVRAECRDHLVLRTAWLYGAAGSCFPRTIARLIRERGSIAVVDDQAGQPTWTHDVADLTERLVSAAAPPGTYHATSSGHTTWFHFARAVAEATGTDADAVTATTTDAFPRPAPRPAWSVLDHADLGLAGVEPIGHWRDRWTVARDLVLGGPAAQRSV